MAKYELLQTLVVSLILAYTFQLLAAKVGIISGNDIGFLVRRHFPAYQCYIIWFMCEVSIISVDI
jgi:NRAMP (natural resistance-associated macrophage protein)-like metal ion transporter